MTNFTINNLSTNSVTYASQTIAAGSTLTVTSHHLAFMYDGNLLSDLIYGNVSVTVNGNDFFGQQAADFIVHLPITFSGSYTLPVSIAPSLGTSGTVYWAMRNNTSGLRMIFQYFYLQSVFSGALNSTTPSNFAICKFGGATPSGGSTLSAVSIDSIYPASNILDARSANGGLTTTGMTIGSTLIPMSALNQAGYSTVIQQAGAGQNGIVLNFGEGLVIKSTNSVSTSISVNGIIGWSELP